MKRYKEITAHILCPKCGSGIIAEATTEKIFEHPCSSMSYNITTGVHYRCSECEYHCGDTKELVIIQPKVSMLIKLKYKLRELKEKLIEKEDK